MIVYDKEQKEIVIPNGIGNINLYNNGIEAGYNQGYEQGQADVAANARVLNVTENGNYLSRFSDPIIPTVTGVYADGTEFYNCAELDGKVFNTKIEATTDSRLEFWFKGKNTTTKNRRDVIIGSNGIIRITIEYSESNDIIVIYFGTVSLTIRRWTNEIWHHFIVSKAEGMCIDGKRLMNIPSNATIEGGGMFIINASYDYNKNSNGTFGMIKIDDTIIIPTADGFLNTNTGKLLKVEKDGGYTFTENAIIYGEGELYKTINVNVPDLNGSYDEGYAQGKIDGVNEQKSKLESISITENGTYNKEDGYNHIEVNVADLNGSYDEGYNQGQADVAANARVLNVTENGNYLSKFSDPIIPTLVTGRYADGTDFYSYAELNGKVFNTKITPTENSRLEFWYKGDNENAGKSFNVIIGAGKSDGNGYEIMYNMESNLRFELGLNAIEYAWDDTVWHHILIAKEKEDDSWMTLWIDEVKIGEFGNIPFNPQSPFYINCIESNTDLSKNANGYFGMIKIDDVIIIPMADGFQNVNTGELLEVVKDGAYIFTENLPIYAEGELYKTINVNVAPKINLQKEGIKLAYGKFTEVPEWADFNGITNMSNMFSNSGLQTIPEIDTSKVTDMNNMFYACFNLITIPLLNTSNVTTASYMFGYCPTLKTLPNNFNLGACTDLSNLFDGSGLNDYSFLETWVINPNAEMGNMITNGDTTYVPAIPCVGNTGYYQSAIFWAYGDYSKLTYFGGWIGRKYNVTQDYILKKMPNLTYESCISILNNLYDFTGNGETPNSEQGHLKVAQSFIDKVGDEISIGINKGWSISV